MTNPFKTIPDLLRTLDVGERVLIALAPGPTTMHALSLAVGVTSTVLWKVIDRLHRDHRIRRFGARHTSVWALASYAGEVPQPCQSPRSNKIRPTGPPTREASWWLTSTDAHFTEAARRRATAMGWVDDV